MFHFLLKSLTSLNNFYVFWGEIQNSFFELEKSASTYFSRARCECVDVGTQDSVLGREGVRTATRHLRAVWVDLSIRGGSQGHEHWTEVLRLRPQDRAAAAQHHLSTNTMFLLMLWGLNIQE